MFNLMFARLFLGEASLSCEDGRQIVTWNAGSILERRAYIEDGVCVRAELLDVNGEWREEGAGHLVEDLNQCLTLFDSMGMDIADVAGQGLGALADAPVASFSLAG